MPVNLSGDEEDTCSNCGGEGYVEMEFPVGPTAEEPDIRSMMCPECNEPNEPDYDYDDREDYGKDYTEPNEF